MFLNHPELLEHRCRFSRPVADPRFCISGNAGPWTTFSIARHPSCLRPPLYYWRNHSYPPLWIPRAHVGSPSHSGLKGSSNHPTGSFQGTVTGWEWQRKAKHLPNLPEHRAPGWAQARSSTCKAQSHEAGPTSCLQGSVPSFWKEKGEERQYPQWLTSPSTPTHSSLGCLVKTEPYPSQF